jgi:hypothetical protein
MCDWPIESRVGQSSISPGIIASNDTRKRHKIDQTELNWGIFACFNSRCNIDCFGNMGSTDIDKNIAFIGLNKDSNDAKHTM